MDTKRNMGTLQRFLRLMAGVMMIAGGIFFLKTPALGYGLMAMGAMGILTGLAGHCPLCSLHNCPTDAPSRSNN